MSSSTASLTRPLRPSSEPTITPYKEKMKTSLFAAFLLALSLTACNSEKSASTEAAPAATQAAPAADAALAAPAAPLSAEDAEKEKIRKQNAAAEAALSGH